MTRTRSRGLTSRRPFLRDEERRSWGFYFLFCRKGTTITTPFVDYLIDLYGTNTVFILPGLWPCLATAVGWLLESRF
jgi:hypothetical protein